MRVVVANSNSLRIECLWKFGSFAAMYRANGKSSNGVVGGVGSSGAQTSFFFRTFVFEYYWVVAASFLPFAPPALDALDARYQINFKLSAINLGLSVQWKLCGGSWALWAIKSRLLDSFAHTQNPKHWWIRGSGTYTDTQCAPTIYGCDSSRGSTSQVQSRTPKIDFLQ